MTAMWPHEIREKEKEWTSTSIAPLGETSPEKRIRHTAMEHCLSEIGQITENVLDAANAANAANAEMQQEGKAHKITMEAKAMETISVGE